MTRNLALTTALGLAALAFPALAQEYAGDEQGSWFGDEASPPPEGAPADDGGARVDVSVDMAAPNASVSFDTFHDGLASQGEWVTMPSYGRVWRPAGVAAGWRPYYYGRWEWTDEGWLWVSDEPWGWATYHYGRWAYDDGGFGWVWVPGYQWAPAWVTWRYSPDYVGWAPLGPGFSVYVTGYPVVFNWWTFVPCSRFVGVPVYTVGYTGAHVRNIWHFTRPAPPRAVIGGARAPAWGGPARPFIENRAGHPVLPVRVQPVGSPGALVGAGRAGVVPIYRPEVRAAPRGWTGGAVTSPGRGVAPAPGSAAPRPWGGQAAPRPVAPQAPGARPAAPPQMQNRWVPEQSRPAAPPQQNRYGSPRAPARYYGPPSRPVAPHAAPAPRMQAPPPQQQRQQQHGGGGGGGGARPAPAHGGNHRER